MPYCISQEWKFIPHAPNQQTETSPFHHSLAASNHKPSYKPGNSFPFIRSAFCMCRDLKISAAFRVEGKKSTGRLIQISGALKRRHSV